MTLRVLHCIYDDVANPWLGGGGAVRVRELYARLRDDVDVTIACGAYPGASYDERIDGARVIRLGARRPYAWSRLTFARAAQRLLSAGAYDAAVVDFSSYTPIVIPRRACVGVTVHHLASEDPSHSRARRALLRVVERRMLRHARVVSVSSPASRSALASLGVAPAHVMEVGAGVDDRLFHVVRNESDYVLAFGRLDVRHKGLDTVIAAAAMLVREMPDLRLVVAGNGRDAARITALASEAGVAGRLVVRQNVSASERDALFAGARVALMPSRFEGFGLAAVEMMAAGVPLVASTAGSLPDVVGDGAVLVPPDDAPALAHAARQLLADAAQRAALSARARAAAARHTWSAAAAQHLAFLEAIALLSRA